MHEVCFCGWFGALTEREPIALASGGWGLACPRCGHVDQLTWLPIDARAALVAAARRERAATDALVAAHALAATH
jgi:hypothetical protein